MLTVTINIAGRGTGVNDAGNGQPGTSSVGHMWYELNNGEGGPPESYGFAPDAQHHGDPFAPGDIYRNDSGGDGNDRIDGGGGKGGVTAYTTIYNGTEYSAPTAGGKGAANDEDFIPNWFSWRRCA